MKVEFYRHNIGQREIDDVTKVLNSVFLTTGDVVDEFERRFSRYLGCGYTVGLMSCTAALHLSLVAYGIGSRDEVITTPMTFIATATSIIQAGATPVFVDVEPDTGNINADLIESAITPRTRAILPVHLYGNMVDVRKIRRIADKHSLVIVEDAAHAIESSRDGIRVGELGNTSCFSFYATKNLTAGESGAVCTNNKEIADKIRLLRWHGIDKGAAERYTKKYGHWDMVTFGWKENMDNIKASLLLNQLDNIEAYWQRREAICQQYEKAFNDAGIITMKVLPNTKSGRHMFTILVNPKERDGILHKLQEKGIGVAVNYRAIHLLTYFKERYGYKRGMFPIAESIGDRTITLPLYPKLADEEVEYVIKTVKEVLHG